MTTPQPQSETPEKCLHCDAPLRPESQERPGSYRRYECGNSTDPRFSYQIGAGCYRRQKEDLERRLRAAEAWQEEIKAAIHRSGMGIMRTSQGPSGTLIGYTEENEKAHFAKEREIIRENIDLDVKLKAAEAERDDLARWKREALEVANQLQEQEIGKEIGLTLGQRISPAILPWIKEVKAKLTALETAAEGMERALVEMNDFLPRARNTFQREACYAARDETELLVNILRSALTRYRALKENGGDAT